MTHYLCAVSWSSSSQTKLPVYMTVNSISLSLRYTVLLFKDQSVNQNPTVFFLHFSLLYLSALLDIGKWLMHRCNEKYLIKCYRRKPIQCELWLPLPDLALLLFLTSSKCICTSMLGGIGNWFCPVPQMSPPIFCQLHLLPYLWAPVKLYLIIQENLPTYCNNN